MSHLQIQMSPGADSMYLALHLKRTKARRVKLFGAGPSFRVNSVAYRYRVDSAGNAVVLLGAVKFLSMNVAQNARVVPYGTMHGFGIDEATKKDEPIKRRECAPRGSVGRSEPSRIEMDIAVSASARYTRSNR